VQLAVNGTHCGENLPLYVRDQMAGELHKLGIAITPYARLYGCDDNTVYLQHTASGEPMLMENIDTLVLCQGHQPVDTLGPNCRAWWSSGALATAWRRERPKKRFMRA
jgi:hypothetical protein